MKNPVRKALTSLFHPSRIEHTKQLLTDKTMNNEQKEALDKYLLGDYDGFNHDCELDGHFLEVIGTAPDGSTFAKCKECGKEIEE